MQKDALKSIFEDAVKAVLDKAQIAGLEPPEIAFGTPPSEDMGDYSCNAAMLLTKQLRIKPRQIAEAICAEIGDKHELIDHLEIAGPGFINIFLTDKWWQDTIRRILTICGEYGKTEAKSPLRIQIEFVSANPVGPLNVVNARAAAYGDSLANLLAAVGNTVEREYLVNDAGNQVVLFGQSVGSAYMALLGLEWPFPENGYRGDYIEDVAKWAFAQHGDTFKELDRPDMFERFTLEALAHMIGMQKRTLLGYGVEFDNWFSDKELRDSGALEQVKELLSGRDSTYEQEDALWFRATTFGEERDRVLVKQDGEPTYLLGDLAFHKNKFERGFDELIVIWGPDHQGQVKGLLGGIEAMGYDAGKVKIIISGHIRLLRGGEALTMSKRAGDFISMDELLADVGKDAARFFFLLRTAPSHLDFDLDLAKKETPENPVYYVQYAHARVRSIFKKADERGIEAPELTEADLTLLEAEEVQMAKRLCRFPELIQRAAAKQEPHHICYYLIELASEFHTYYNKTKVLTEEPDTTAARLALCEAVRQVIANGLALIGVSAPEAM